MADTSLTSFFPSSTASGSLASFPSKTQPKQSALSSQPADPRTSAVGQNAMGSLQSDSSSSTTFKLSQQPDSTSTFNPRAFADLDAKRPVASTPSSQSDFTRIFVTEVDSLPPISDPTYETIVAWIELNKKKPLHTPPSFPGSFTFILDPGEAMLCPLGAKQNVQVSNNADRPLTFYLNKSTTEYSLRVYSFTPSVKSPLGGFYFFKEIEIPLCEKNTTYVVSVRTLARCRPSTAQAPTPE